MIVLYLLLCLLVNQNEAARILAVFPTPSISHQVVFRPLVQELAKRGHEVVVITTDPAFPKGEAPANLTEIDVHDETYEVWMETIMAISKGDTNDLGSQLKAFMLTAVQAIDAQLNNEEVRKMINDKDERFDLLLVEACIKPALLFSHIYKVPVIQVSSLGALLDNYESVGASTHPIIYPIAMHQRIHNLTLWEKVTLLYSHYKLLKLIEDSDIMYNELLKKHLGNDAPDINELSNNVQMIFLNIHPIFEGIRAVPPNLIYMGGLHQNPEKELPADIKSYLDSSKNGVIYFSLGTNVDPTLFPPDKIQTLVKVFSQLPYDVLWKWNEDKLPGRSDNIKIFKWLPQSDLLRHPKIKLFITQGGLQSTDEAITAGVPLIGMPMLGDQWFNVEKYVYHGIGKAVHWNTLTVEELKDAINNVIGDISYRKNIIRLRELMRDEPMKPLERAVWWTEYVLRHGGAKHLRAAGANITWWEFFELELLLTLLGICLTVITAFAISFNFVYRFILRKYLHCDKIKKA